MPYTITTTSTVEPVAVPGVTTFARQESTRRAVATLDEARDFCRQYIADHKREPHRPWRAWLKPGCDLLAPGMQVGPLPDETVITVEETDYDELVDPGHAVWDAEGNLAPGQEAEIIAAYNSREG